MRTRAVTVQILAIQQFDFVILNCRPTYGGKDCEGLDKQWRICNSAVSVIYNGNPVPVDSFSIKRMKDNLIFILSTY